MFLSFTLTPLSSSDLIKLAIAWTLLFGGMGALLGWCKHLIRTGLIYGLTLGPLGLCVILVKQPLRDHDSPMHARRQLGRRARVLLRAGLAVSLLIVLVWIGSPLIHASYVRAYNPPRRVTRNPWSTIGISCEHVVRLRLLDGVFVAQNTQWFTGPQTRVPADQGPGLHFGAKTLNPAGLLPGKLIPWFEGGPFWYIEIPLWTVFLLFAIPTARLSVLDRPFLAYACENCGYDLTGNLSGICPECGAHIHKAQ